MHSINSWVDAHHHLWDLDKVNYPWLIAKGEERFFGQPDSIRKNYLLSDFTNDHQHKISHSVHIQVGATDALKETHLIHDLSQSETHGNFPSAAVVAINMRQTSIEQELSQHLPFNLVRGVRDIIGKSPEENKLLSPFMPKVWLENWQYLAKKSLSFDLQLTAEQYKTVLTTLEQVPELKVAICHFASPWDQSATGFNSWQQQMREFAQLPNCYMKLSGFSMFKQAFDVKTFKQYAHAAIDIFGAHRCMFGSNFPVDKLYISYDDLFAQWRAITTDYSQNEANFLAAQTAKNFYLL